MRKVEMGSIVVWSDARAALHPADVEEALGRHGRGDAGEAGLRNRIRNHLLVCGRYGFFSAHRDRSGREFGIITDSESDPVETHVFLREA